MKKKNAAQPTRHKYSLLRQLCNFIPSHLVPKLARDTGVEKKSRTFLPWSHVVSLVSAQLTHAISLNDVCDALRLNSGPLSAVRGATPPSRNNLSHANRTRDPVMAEQLFWQVLEHLQKRSAGFCNARRRVPAFRFRRVIHAIDSTTIKLVMNCFDWARHRRRKAAAKLHVRLNLQSFLPGFAVVKAACEHDSRKAPGLCAGIKAGEIVVFDMAYLVLEHLFELTQRGVFWVTRAKENLDYRVVKRRQNKRQGAILRDDIIQLRGPKSKKLYAAVLRRVVAEVEIDGQIQVMEFLTNNLEWSAQCITDLYRCRWEIEVFFKQIKQTLQLADFLGHNEKAVKWQIWTALLTYLLLRYLGFLSNWAQSFSRLWAITRAVLWRRLDGLDLFSRVYGTARGSWRLLGAPQQAYLPGFSKICGTAHA